MCNVTKAALYTRISQDREGAGLGVQRQEQDCRELAARLGFEEIEVFSDNDVSAYSGKPRPEYARMLEAVESGEITVVICWHTDRLHRSPKDLERYIDACGRIPTYTVKAGHLDLTTASGRMTARITGAVARHESEHKSERQRRKTEELAALGQPLGGGRPFGYEEGGLTVRQSEADELRAAVRAVLAGESLAGIIRDLDSRGVRTTRGKTWSYSSLRSLLLRPRNCGRMQHRGQVVGRAAWEAIISETDHDAVVAVLSDPARKTTTTSARRHLLSGILKCHCGLPMKSGWTASRGRRSMLYRCKVQTKGHANRSMPRVDEYVISQVLDQLDAVGRGDHNDNTGALELERSEITERLDQAAVMFAEGTITAAQLQAVTSRLGIRLEQITEELSASATAVRVHGMDRAEWEELSLDRRRKIIDALMTITAHPVGRGPLPHDCGVEITLKSDPTGSRRFGFTMPEKIAEQVRRAAG